MTFEQRVREKYEPVDGGCWQWKAFVAADGYGRCRVGGAIRLAHRVVYELLVGPIPDGLTLDHTCRNRACVNPGHLEPVTFRENVLRGEGLTAQNARKTHCKRGHRFTPENTIRQPSGRRCRTCHKASNLRSWHRRKART